MAMLGYITITGDEQGAIEGSSTHEMHLNEIEVLKLDHQIEVQGATTAGQVAHGSLKINKLIDKSSPKLAQALCTREVLSEIIITWYHHNANGERELAYKIVLENALITNLNAWTPHFYEQSQEEFRLMEDVCFSYEKILWSWGSEGEVEYEISARGAS